MRLPPLRTLRGRALGLGVGTLAVTVLTALTLHLAWDAQAPSASLDHGLRFNSQGQLPLDDPSRLPVPPGSARVEWYVLRGWYVAVIEGLDPAVVGRLCIGTSIRNRAIGRYEYISNSTADAINPTPCTDDRGAGAEVLGTYDMGQYGGRSCGGEVGYVTRIPSDLDGTLLLWVGGFPGDGTGVAVSGQVETSSGRLREVDARHVACAPLPDRRMPVIVTPTVTPAPPSKGAVAASRRKPAPTPKDPGGCFSTEAGRLQEVDGTPAAPYLLRVPPRAKNAPVVIFLPGGSGTAGGARSVWTRFFADRAEADRFVVVIPYVKEGDLLTDTGRMLVILNEVLRCTGADPQRVHLAGTSNGGLAAFALMSAHPEYFATLLGAPGAFPVPDPSKVKREVWAGRLAGRPVFNGVGAMDGEWNAEVMATHNALAAAGIESRFVEFPGQGHVTNATFDPAAFFEFWSNH